MKKFIVTYLAPYDATWKTQESTPEEMEAGASTPGLECSL